VLWTDAAAIMTGTLCAVVGRSLTEAEWGQFLPDYPYHATCG
jgi:hypothetical protein